MLKTRALLACNQGSTLFSDRDKQKVIAKCEISREHRLTLVSSNGPRHFRLRVINQEQMLALKKQKTCLYDLRDHGKSNVNFMSTFSLFPLTIPPISPATKLSKAHVCSITNSKETQNGNNNTSQNKGQYFNSFSS